MKRNERKEKGIAGAILAFVLIIVIAVGGAVAGWYAHAQNWFGLAAAEPKQEVSTTGSGGLIVGESEGNGITITAARTADVSTLSEDSYTLTATVSPSDATYKKVDWSIAWANGESAWASGKTVTDYVTITPTDDGAITATVACTQPFGEQITVKCTSRENTSISATATADYAKRISSVNVTFDGSDAFKFSTEYSVMLTPVYSVGTVDTTANVKSVDFLLTEGFVAELKKEASGRIVWNSSNLAENDYASDASFSNFSVNRSDLYDVTGDGAAVNLLAKEADKAIDTVAYYYDGVDATLKVNYEYSYGGNVLGSGTASCDVRLYVNVVNVTSMNVNGNIVF